MTVESGTAQAYATPARKPTVRDLNPSLYGYFRSS